MNSSLGKTALDEELLSPGPERKNTYWDLYQAIDRGEDLSAAQLFYLNQLVRRKLRDHDSRLYPSELVMKPYAQDEDIPEEYFLPEVVAKGKGRSSFETSPPESPVNKKERRKYPRFRVRGTVIVKACSSPLPSGTVSDISRSGLAFHYRENGHNPHDIGAIDIVWADFVAAHRLRAMPVQTVSDVLLGYEDKGGSVAVHRKRAVRFRDLSAAQAGALDRLLRVQGTAAV